MDRYCTDKHTLIFLVVSFIYRVGQKSDTSRTVQCNVPAVSLFWPTLYVCELAIRTHWL